MYRSQTLALKYFAAAISFFGVMTITGLLSSYYYLNPDFLFGILPFNIMKILHINTLVIWLLMGFMGSIYWFLPGELGRETAGIGLLRYCFTCFARRLRWSQWCSSLSNTAAATRRPCG
jgi:nitric oxide reductase subunit B